MAMTVSELQVKVSADTSQAESGLASLGSKVGSIGGMIGTAFGAAAVGGIAAVGGALVASVGAAATFEQSMSAIQAVSGATGAEMQQMSALALQLGKDTSFSASEAADGIGELVKAGVSVADVMGGGAKAALDLAAAGGLSVAESASIASNAMNVFSLKGADVGHVADVIAGAANASAIDVHDFGMSLAASGSVAATVGIGFDDLGTAIAVMGQAGIKGSDAGTSLKTMLLNLTPASKQQLEVSKALGITTADGANKFFDASGKAKSMAEIAEILKTSTAGLTEQQKLQALQTLFGTDAIRAAAIMAKAGAEGFDTMAESIGKVTAADVAKTRLDNLKGSIEQLKGSLETAGIGIGTLLLPGLRAMVDGLTEWVNKGIGIIDMLPDAWADVKTAFTTGETGDAFGELLAQLGLSDDTVFAAIGWTVKLGDAWRTMQQVFAGNWSPSDQIDPFVNSVGIAATAVRDFKDAVVEAIAKAGAMGAWDNIATGFSNLADAAGLASDRVDDIGAALSRARDPAAKVATAADLMAGAIKGAALGFQYATMIVDDWIDQIGSAIAVGIDFATGVERISEAWTKLQSGDIRGAITSLGQAKDAFGAGATAAEDFRQRGLLATAAEAKTLADMMGIHMTATKSAVETNMDAANRAVAEGSSGWQREMEANGADMVGAAETAGQGVATATETGMAAAVSAVESQGPAAVAGVDAMGAGMTSAIETAGPAMTTAADTAATGVVTAVEGQTPAATAAADAMGTGMAAGIQAAAPQMAAAADSGASGAVAAVQAQQGPASGAGQSIGDAIGSGLEGGILGWAGRVAAAAAGVVRAAIDAARGSEGADAHSPSKKTQQLGEDMAEGLEIGLNKSGLGDAMIAQIRDFIAASRDYIPVAGQIKGVEQQIKDIRDRAQTDALFRGQQMITIDSEALRLKGAQVTLERDLIPLRQRLADATREVTDIERGSLADRTRLIEMDGQQKTLRLQEIDLEQQLIGLDPGSKKAASIQKAIDKLRDQSKELDLESEKTRLTGEVAATASRVKQEALSDDARNQQAVIDKIKDQIDILGGEQSVFSANENVIKNATDNEVGYRNRLIAVFTAEGKPLADRVTAGLKLVEQLHSEGKISDDLYNAIKKVADKMGDAKGATSDFGSAAQTATPQIDGATKKAQEMAAQAAAVAAQAQAAASKVDALSSSLGKLPDWFRPGHGSSSSGSLFNFGGTRATGGPVTAGMSYLVGERRPELFTPDRSGTILPLLPSSSSGSAGRVETHVFRLANPDGRTLAEWHVVGKEMAVDMGLLPRGN